MLVLLHICVLAHVQEATQWVLSLSNKANLLKGQWRTTQSSLYIFVTLAQIISVLSHAMGGPIKVHLVSSIFILAHLQQRTL